MLAFRGIVSAFLLFALNQFAQFFDVEGQVVFGGISLGVKSLELFIGMADAGRLQDRMLNFQPQRFSQFSFRFLKRHGLPPIKLNKSIVHAPNTLRN